MRPATLSNVLGTFRTPRPNTSRSAAAAEGFASDSASRREYASHLSVALAVSGFGFRFGFRV